MSNHKTIIYLQKHLQSVQRSCARSTDASGHSPGRQMAPPHARLHFALCEIIRYVEILANVQVLQEKWLNLVHGKY